MPGAPPPGRGGRSLRWPGPRSLNGRSGRPAPSGRGRCTPIPWREAKGLLPGRGAPVRRAPPGSPPVPPGRGPGRGRGTAGDGVGVGAAAALGAALAAVGAGRSETGSAGAASGCGGADSTFGAAGAGAAALLGAAGRCGAGLASAAAGAAFPAEAFSRSFLTTGASIVEEAERTNSPMSLRVCKSSLLSSPSSFASS